MDLGFYPARATGLQFLRLSCPGGLLRVRPVRALQLPSPLHLLLFPGFSTVDGTVSPPVSRGSPAPESGRLACCAAGGAAGAGAGSLRRRLAGFPASLFLALPPPSPARFPPSAAAMAAAPGPARPSPGPGALRRSGLCSHVVVRDSWFRRRRPRRPLRGGTMLLLALTLYSLAGGAHDPIRPDLLPLRLLRLPSDGALCRRVAGDTMSR